LSAICLVRLARTPDNAVVRAVVAMPEVSRCDALSGEIDLLVELSTSDAPSLNAARDQIAAMPGVVEVTTSLVLTRYSAKPEVNRCGKPGAIHNAVAEDCHVAADICGPARGR
jgi:DNA-binding Lrp family transcriptional regulator